MSAGIEAMSEFAMKFNVLGSTRMTESLDNLIWHLICISSTKSAPRNVTMSQVPLPLFYLRCMSLKKETRFVSINGISIEISFSPIVTIAPPSSSIASSSTFSFDASV
jgi:hypothetical protein